MLTHFNNGGGYPQITANLLSGIQSYIFEITWKPRQSISFCKSCVVIRKTCFLFQFKINSLRGNEHCFSLLCLILINNYGKQVSLVLLSCTFLPLTVPTSGEMSWERTHWLYSLTLASRYNK